MKLDIGNGPLDAHGPDFVTIDAYAPADICADMWSLPFPDGSVSEIWSSHALEHIARAKVMPTLREWHRVLEPGGVATISVPDLDYAVRYWLAHKGQDRALQLLFGNQKHDGEYHRTGWSLRSLRADVEGAGLVVRRLNSIWDHAQQTLRVVAVKR